MKIPKIGKEGKAEFVELPDIEPTPPETSPGEIDARRAKHVLERAVQLAEKGDYPGAILAARQAIALDHDFGDAHSVLGGLLERTGDLKGAVAAHERAIALLPQNTLERTTLERLQEKLGAQSGGLFNFDESDGALFDPKTELPPVIDAKLPPTRAEIEAQILTEALAAQNPSEAPAPTPENSAVSIRDTPLSAVEASVVAVPNEAPAVPARTIPEIKISVSEPAPRVAPSITAPPAAVQRRTVSDRRQVNIPITTERRSGHDRRADAATLAARAQSASTPFVFNPLIDAPKPPLWAQTLRGPSFFARTLPLVAVTIFSLGFLSWARGRAVEQNRLAIAPAQTVPIDPVPALAPPQNQVVTPPQRNVLAPGPNLAPPLQPGQTGAQSGFDINNRPIVVSRPAVNTTAPATPRTGTVPRSNPRVTTGNQRTTPNFPNAQLPPAAIAPGAAQNRGTGEASGDGGGNLGLPPADIPPAQPQNVPTRVLPPDAGSPSGGSANPPGVIGGGALNPAGSPARGFVRIQSGRSVGSSPPRSENQANNSERAAASAARGGQSDRAIQDLTNAIQTNPGDAAFRLQQRANLFLDRGDNARAAEDFQAAISAYQDQIARGEDVNSARAGLRSARSGLNRALSARR